MHRPTRGIDLLDLERRSAEEVVATLHDALGSCREELAMDWSAMRIRTRAERRSPLHRVCIPARIGRHRLYLRIAVMAARHPLPEMEFRPFRVDGASCSPVWVACCTAEEIVAEKLALLVTYGPDHTRVQDILDIWLLLRRIRLDWPALSEAMVGVFQGRDAAQMVIRGDGYCERAFDPERLDVAIMNRWDALVRSASVQDFPVSLPDALIGIWQALGPLLLDLRQRGDRPCRGVARAASRVGA
ncbi:nucleotidyl transferase AbiEii/AbiGii toxin family protein [Pararoseomonas indoligenes]|uniref:Nucleotidyl transferase AbiEii/AbiGii toxin family protein n=1 Tax=Roseomonas indoligenes TaxID=2820811 RepID=A0A940N2W3_9PROT|nr:nucleotidyl transferase AbiEii/AbiGii toxin family protein [Pararoseomonas indoligenes]MBP0495750.1 nucleotidyl transferase AbiEii/AbiGii toxin family protein [Pararoseomonas indoligenes]